MSTKTLYRHFDGKDDLFSAVMLDACAMPVPEGFHDHGTDATGLPDLRWYTEEPAVALPIAGADYLRTVLSPTGLSLYRVVTRDAPRFPELGHRYHEVVEFRIGLLARYLERWPPAQNWNLADPRHAAGVFVALLDSDLFLAALHGLRVPADEEITNCAHTASADLLTLIDNGAF